MLDWLVHDRGIELHIPVFDKSQRTDGTFSRDDFTYDHATDTYRCPAGKTLQHYRRRFAIPRTGIMKDNSMRYRASKRDCQGCQLKPRGCPKAPARKISRSIYEGRATWPRGRQDRGLSDLAAPTQKGRDAVRTPQAHSEARPITRSQWGARRIPPRSHRPEPSQARHAGSDSPADTGLRGHHPSPTPLAAPSMHHPSVSKTYFFNGIARGRGKTRHMR